ncbi:MULTISPECIES: response regulator [unclassified Rhizobium]|uniref:response regulator transcription factor n=1 Tax=unclassified Rhizobium TaxID=2613769 RepID=UPI000EA9375A|nr:MULTISPECIES: response regulator [unclassified Rhizobium]AYG70080.1 DNA-binding response regulator [Rhizobium sp. CCGE531]AYG76455.1 DNA-binding response regulator [Rhizobium sp. CCGE532]
MQNLQLTSDSTADPIVYVIDDDKDVRDALLDLFEATKRRATAYSSGHEFLSTADTSAPGCVVVELRMPEGTGLDVQSHLIAIGSRMPVIFLTADADVPASIRAMKAGAADFLTKPFVNQDLLDAVDHAIRQDGARRKLKRDRDRIRALVDTLTPRELEVMFGVISGLMNKQVAYQLGISEMTVKLHRMSVMRKMQSRSLADLVRKAEKLQRN